MSLKLYPKCPECGHKTALKYKLDIFVKGTSECNFCKAKLIPEIYKNWLLKLLFAMLLGYIAHIFSEIIFLDGAPAIRALMIFFSAIIGFNIIDIFSKIRAFRL